MVGAKALAGLLFGAIATGFVLSSTSAVAGGLWSQAAIFVASGDKKAADLGGKGGSVHRALAFGVTVGDPFKDAAGPAINVLVKLMAAIALVLAPVFRDSWVTWWQGFLVFILELAALASVWYYVWMRHPEEDIGVSKATTIPDPESGSPAKLGIDLMSSVASEAASEGGPEVTADGLLLESAPGSTRSTVRTASSARSAGRKTQSNASTRV